MRVLALILALAALGYLNFVRYEVPIETDPLPVTSGLPDDLAAAGSSQDVPAPGANGELRQVQTFSRPLFNDKRRPFVKKKQEPAKPKPAAKAAAVKKPDFVILGISETQGVRKALMMQRGGAAAEWLPVGGRLARFEVVEIGDSNVSVRQGDAVFGFDLYPEKQAGE
ncbi:MAG: hypothetical protein KDJ80_06920 [Nitratireductor sp.]|nr:hypothetical protein [Nitratireductor sp.]